MQSKRTIKVCKCTESGASPVVITEIVLLNCKSWDRNHPLNVSSLAFTTHWAYSADNKLTVFFLFFQKNRI